MLEWNASFFIHRADANGVLLGTGPALTPHVKRGKIKIGEELVIEALPSGEKFQTVVSDKGNKLRARGQIARFYKEAKVQPGDHVLLTEVAPGRWTLKKAPPGEYGPVL
jgi:hypothetical protein